MKVRDWVFVLTMVFGVLAAVFAALSSASWRPIEGYKPSPFERQCIEHERKLVWVKRRYLCMAPEDVE